MTNTSTTTSMASDVLHIGHFIGGQSLLVPDESGRKIEVYDPCQSDHLVGTAPIAIPKTLDLAVESAAQAFHSWRKVPAKQRASILLRAADGLDAQAQQIGNVLAREAGRVLSEAIKEVYAAASQIRYYAHEIIRWRGQIIQSDDVDRQVLLIDRPIGVVFIVSPWNNPLFLLSRCLAPAIAAGCTVIAKPSSETPLSSFLMAEALHESGLHPGIFNVVTGQSEMIASHLLAHPMVRKAALTGGTTAGQSLASLAGQHLKPVTLELGGQCPAIVCEDARLDTAADAITFQAFRQGGHVCNRVNRVYVQRHVYSKFVDMLRQRIAEVCVGTIDDPNATYSALINIQQVTTAQQHIEDALTKGASLETGGHRITTPPLDQGYFFEPTLLSKCTDKMLVMNEETFGPVLGVAAFDEIEQAFDRSNNTPYGLAAYLFTQNATQCHRAMVELDVGNLWINDIHTSYPQCPYGGCKASGFGRTQGREALAQFLESTTVSWDYADYHRGQYTTGH